jgi:hypothetical protein
MTASLPSRRAKSRKHLVFGTSPFPEDVKGKVRPITGLEDPEGE